MLTQHEANVLSARLDELSCTDPEAGSGLFLYVFKGEPPDLTSSYDAHMRTCEYCRIALELYRYKRAVAELLGKEKDGPED